jgi:hypothetical protein
MFFRLNERFRDQTEIYPTATFFTAAGPKSFP